MYMDTSFRSNTLMTRINFSKEANLFKRLELIILKENNYHLSGSLSVVGGGW